MRAICSFFLVLLAAACGGAVREPPQATGEVIAYGGGPGGARYACFTCHGLAGEGAGHVPRLAGLNAGYLAKQLDDYARELRPDDVMAPIARALSDTDRRAVAAYYEALPHAAADAMTAAPAIFLHGDARRGLIACARCHGEIGDGRGQAFPAITAQPAIYTAEQLRRWKHGKRRNDGADTMGRIARVLSEEEIDDLARYLER